MRKRKRILTLLLVGIICFSYFPKNVTAVETVGVTVGRGREDIVGDVLGTAEVVNPKIRSTVNSSCTITPGADHSYGSWSTCEFSIGTDTGTYLGFCAQPNMDTPSGTFQVSELQNDVIKALILCYIVPELYTHIGANVYEASANNTYAYCHAAIGYVYSGSLKGLSASQQQGVIHMVAVVHSILDGAGEFAGSGLTTLLNSYMPKYKLYVAYNDQQDIVWAEYISEGYMKLQKSSANTSITNNNSCYSLSGAVYGVYSNSSCTTQVGTLTTTADGSSNTLTIAAGTYYVKETMAPKGYALETTVHTVTVTSGNTAILKVTDVPQSNPVSVLLEKVDAETNANKPQGSATLVGAHFEVKYYTVQMSTDPAKNGYTATRTWVLETDEDGYCELSDSYKVSGDEFYLTSNGDPTLPIGTVTIRETIAPEGYLINPTVYVQQITSSGTTERMQNYSCTTVPETTLDLNIVKKEAGTTIAISGAVFKHTLPDGTIEEVTTDSEGKAVFKALTYGTHTVEEVCVLDGYTLNPGKVIFEVATNNTIILTDNTSDASTGIIKFTTQSDGCALLEVEEVLAPYSLTVHKKNENGKVLKGAEFTLYSDAECKTKVTSGTSDDEGLITFENLIVGTDYYLKEIKAPTGYHIPVNSDGSDIVYKIKTTSDPIKGTFEYYVNDIVHTDETGDFAITGTTADRKVNLTVVNYTGIKMPETGSRANMFPFLVESGTMLLAYVFTKKKERENDYDKI